METSIDKFGRVLIPKGVREEIGLEPGTVLEIEQADGKILLQIQGSEPKMVDKQGVLVFTGTASADLVDAVKNHRQERLRKVMHGL
jgi:AbrB family looped-hinge helix DNA binding protein